MFFLICTHQNMKSPEIQEKYKQGPVGVLTVFPSGPPAMPKFLGLWFAYCLIIGIVVAYLTWHTRRARRTLSARLSRRWARRRFSPTAWEI